MWVIGLNKHKMFCTRTPYSAVTQARPFKVGWTVPECQEPPQRIYITQITQVTMIS